MTTSIAAVKETMICLDLTRFDTRLFKSHRTKYQESVNGNVVELCEIVAETRRLTRVSASSLMTFTHVSVAAVTTEPEHFFYMFLSGFS